MARHRGQGIVEDMDPSEIDSAAAAPWYVRSWRQGLPAYLPWLPFFAMPPVATFGHVGPGVWWLVTLDMAVLAVLYLGCTLGERWPLTGRLAWLAAMGVAMLLLPVLCGPSYPVDWALGYLPVVLVGCAALLPWRASRWFIPGLGILGAVVTCAAGNLWTGVSILGMGMLILLGAANSYGGHQQWELARERERNQALAIVAERERIGRDLHDILGHSLTAVAVKAELAARLAQREPAAAGRQIDEVAGIAREALADVRSAATGMRQVRVATEVASARAILAAADVACEVPSALPGYDEHTAELFGYVVREAITNVVRHARARRCRIEASPAAVAVIDDGRGFGGAGGSGLNGLRARAAAVGATLDIASSPAGTTVRCSLGGQP